jgi:hypothetical protein
MSTAVMLERMAEASPRFKARIAGVFYLLTFVTGIFALMSANARLVANLAATACYVAVILLFYHLLSPDLFLIEPEIDPDSGPVLDRPPVPPSGIKAPFPDGRN